MSKPTADRKKQSLRFKPIKVMDVELNCPFPALEGLGEYKSLQVLVRLHGMPLGYVQQPLISGSCSKADLKEAILKEHSGSIIRHLLCDWLAVPLGSERIRIEDLIKESHPVGNHERLPLVTVAVCTRDRTNYLPHCLDALKSLDYPNVDVLLVDNAPGSDTTERLVRTTYPNVRYVCEHRPGLNWARNRAVIEAYGEIIAYTDDDCVVDPGWVKALVNGFSENPDLMAITGLVVPYEFETEAQVLFEKRGGFGKGFQRKWYPTNFGNGRPVADFYGGAGQGTGGNMSFRRSSFNRVGYFDPALDVGTPTHGGGDLEMFFRVIKAGWPLLYEPGAIVRHRHRRTRSELRNQMTDWGIGFGSYLVRSALAYPDERSAFIKRGLGWFWGLNIRDPILSIQDPLGPPWDIILAEAIGSWMVPVRYLTARSIATRIQNTFGPLGQTLIRDARVSANRTKKYGEHTGAFTIDLGQPLPILKDVVDYSRVRISVSWKGRQLGSFEILNCFQIIGATRLREAIVDHLGLRLLDPEGKKSLHDVEVDYYALLSQCFLSLRNGH